MRQGLDPQKLLHVSGRHLAYLQWRLHRPRYSSLDLINQSNVHGLTLAWAFQTHSVSVKSTPLEVNGILYFSVPDHVWAMDATTGRQVWHFSRPSQGDHLGSRGVGMYKDRLFFGTPDAHVICLDARNGKQLWDTVIADVTVGYYMSGAPLVIGDQVIVGTSGDSADVPHFLLSLDPASGKINWRWDAVPKPGEPGSETWPDTDSMSHGGGSIWGAPTYDPELNLIYLGTGNPHPDPGRRHSQGRRSFYLLDRRHPRGHRQAGLVFSALSRTTPMTGMRLRRQSWSTEISMARSGRCCCRPAATATSLFSIGRRARTC